MTLYFNLYVIYLGTILKQIVADNILKLILFFRKNKMTFHVNCLPSRQFTCYAKSYFFWRIKNKYFSMSSAVVVISTLMFNHFKWQTPN